MKEKMKLLLYNYCALFPIKIDEELEQQSFSQLLYGKAAINEVCEELTRRHLLVNLPTEIKVQYLKLVFAAGCWLLVVFATFMLPVIGFLTVDSILRIVGSKLWIAEHNTTNERKNKND